MAQQPDPRKVQIARRADGVPFSPRYRVCWYHLPAARTLIEEASDGELFLYPGEEHLFMDSSLPTYDPKATRLLVQRMLAFLDAH